MNRRGFLGLLSAALAALGLARPAKAKTLPVLKPPAPVAGRTSGTSPADDVLGRAFDVCARCYARVGEWPSVLCVGSEAYRALLTPRASFTFAGVTIEPDPGVLIPVLETPALPPWWICAPRGPITDAYPKEGVQ